jgi:antitoxin MazE
MQQQLRARDIKLVSIGNSKGIRIPKNLLQKYCFGDTLLLVETEQGLLLKKKNDQKISWEETYRAMAAEQEDWSDFDIALLDGLKGADFDD